MEIVPESYFKMFFRGVYFIHKILILEPTEDETIFLEKEIVELKVNLNLN